MHLNFVPLKKNSLSSVNSWPIVNKREISTVPLLGWRLFRLPNYFSRCREVEDYDDGR